jgi:uncharacterized protein (DUF1697 family)
MSSSKLQKSSQKGLSRKIREKIQGDLGFSVPLVLRTLEEMKKIVNDNPFLKEREIDRSKLHATFLAELPAKAALGKLDALNGLPDRFYVKGREIYLFCPNGYGRRKAFEFRF